MKHIGHSQDLNEAAQLTLPERITIWGDSYVSRGQFVPPECTQEGLLFLRDMAANGWQFAQSLCGQEGHLWHHKSQTAGSA